MVNDKRVKTPQVVISSENLDKLGKVIGELDTKIASASGSDTVAKRAFVDNLVTQNAEQVNGITDSVISQFGELDMPILVGLLARLEERLKADLAPKVEAYVTEEFPKTKAPADDVEGLKTQRKELVNQFKALRDVLNAFDVANDHIPDPKRSGGGGRPVGSGGGGSTKSGANKEGYRYLIDGQKRPRSQNSFSSVAFYSTNGCPEKVAIANGASEEDARKLPKKWGANDLKTFLTEKGVNFGVDDSFDIELPNGKRVSARRLTDQDKIELGIVADANDTSDPDSTLGDADVAPPLEPATV